MSAGSGIRAIGEERAHQISKGYTPEHDLQHSPDDLVAAAVAVLADDPHLWPFSDGWKPHPDWRERTVVAGAFLCAAIDLYTQWTIRPDESVLTARPHSRCG